MTRPALFLAAALALGACASAPPPEAAPDAAAPEASGVTGVWDYRISTGDTGTFTITGAPGAYEGEMVARGQTLPLSAVMHNGDTLSFSFVFGGGLFVTAAGTVTAGAFDGTVDAGEMGSFSMTATLQAM